MIQVIVIDDDPLVTESLRTILETDAEITVPAIGHSAEEAIQLYRKIQPNVLLMDIRMGEQTGMDAAKEIFKAYPKAMILLLTTFSDEEYIRNALQIGVKGYLIKQNLADIIPAIKAVDKGQSVFGHEIVDKLSTILTQESRKFPLELTQRETEILEQIAEGKNNKEIAETLFLSEGTIRNYISQLLDKLNVRDRTQLAIYYYKNYR